jgi:hypothetical protein
MHAVQSADEGTTVQHFMYAHRPYVRPGLRVLPPAPWGAALPHWPERTGRESVLPLAAACTLQVPSPARLRLIGFWIVIDAGCHLLPRCSVLQLDEEEDRLLRPSSAKSSKIEH